MGVKRGWATNTGCIPTVYPGLHKVDCGASESAALGNRLYHASRHASGGILVFAGTMAAGVCVVELTELVRTVVVDGSVWVCACRFGLFLGGVFRPNLRAWARCLRLGAPSSMA